VNILNLITADKIHYEIDESDIIDSLSFSGGNNEFVSVIGPSGCGKSTLLRIIAGLIKPSSGRVLYQGEEITEPIREISFVFQDFALLPWLTNIDNVKLGLSYFEMSDKKKNDTAIELLHRFGLDGFEYSYPNILSGGMKQRVGIARAVAQEPSILLMDEPFSSLDELTANTLRSDIVSMLHSKEIPVNLVIMVTHNVEEAVLLSDRIVVLSNKPTVLKGIKKVSLDKPRDKRSRKFGDLVDQVYAALTD
jgi:NitT/TauT family transport system ATP-binding protein